jgi:predicted esterase
VERAVRYTFEHFDEIDPERVWLAGLSQGGAGVGRAAVALPDVFAGLVFISPTMEPAILANEAMAVQRVLVIHGDADRPVTLKCVEQGIEALRSAGADVTVRRDPTVDKLSFAHADLRVSSIPGLLCQARARKPRSHWVTAQAWDSR